MSHGNSLLIQIAFSNFAALPATRKATVLTRTTESVLSKPTPFKVYLLSRLFAADNQYDMAGTCLKKLLTEFPDYELARRAVRLDYASMLRIMDNTAPPPVDGWTDGVRTYEQMLSFRPHGHLHWSL